MMPELKLGAYVHMMPELKLGAYVLSAGLTYRAKARAYVRRARTKDASYVDWGT
jgi:hypothetical protein